MDRIFFEELDSKLYPSTLLPKRQRTAIRLCVQAGLRVKINTVLIPSVNGAEVGEIAQAAAQAGVSLMNIVPLIPCGGMRDLPPPCNMAGTAGAQGGGAVAPSVYPLPAMSG